MSRHDESSWFITMNRDDSWRWIIISHDESWWITMTNHHDSSRWIVMNHHDSSRWTIMIHQDESSWLIMMNHEDSLRWINHIMIHHACCCNLGVPSPGVAIWGGTPHVIVVIWGVGYPPNVVDPGNPSWKSMPSSLSGGVNPTRHAGHTSSKVTTNVSKGTKHFSKWHPKPTPCH